MLSGFDLSKIERFLKAVLNSISAEAPVFSPRRVGDNMDISRKIARITENETGRQAVTFA
ncbi:MAG: hypothetical protein ACJARY_001028 [Candidatus Azotimanducaceae bacterium]